jgi:hypothetical protein
MTDARFEDGEAGPLALLAQGPGDLAVLSALMQDAVLTGADLTYRAKARQLVLLINRFRWEDADEARKSGRRYERVRAVLLVQDVLSVRAQGVQRGDAATIHAILSLGLDEGQDGTGLLTIRFAGDATIEVRVEAVDIALRDVTRPHFAVSGKVPDHQQD